MPVDFHSFRRGFNTALAEADVTIQRATALAAHSDPKTRMRYVMRTAKMRTIPEEAIPPLPSGFAARALGFAIHGVEAPDVDVEPHVDVEPANDAVPTAVPEAPAGAGIVAATDDSPYIDAFPTEKLNDSSGRSRD